VTAATAGDIIVCSAILGALVIASACWSERRHQRRSRAGGPLHRFSQGPVPRHEKDRLTLRERRQFRRIAKTERFARLADTVRREIEARQR
jgi:hypothetical protein